MEEQNNNQEQLTETEAVSETVEEVLETVPAAEEIPAEETPAEEVTAQETPAEPAKKATPGKIAVAVGTVILLASLLIALIVSGQNGKQEAPDAETAEVVETVEATIPADGNPDDVTCKGSYSVSDEEAVAQGDVVVATMGEHQLTNSRLQVYYWMEIQNFLNQYGAYAAYFGLDYTKPLDTQLEEEGLTWQQYFLDTALNNWHQVQSMSLMAQETGLPITEVNKDYLEGLDDYLEQTAAANGVSVEELMVGNFGPGADKEDYRYFQELYLTGVPYYQAAVEAMKPTQEELEAYFAEHEEKYAESGVTKDSKFVDVRHILVQVKGEAADGTYTDAEWETCRADAQAILDTWLAGDKTEESFAALATEKTEDPGSKQNGGLYQQVYAGQMVPEFNDWCFDEARAYGDYDLVKTSYGYHVMFFVKSEPSWISYAESDWMNEQSADLLAAVTSLYPMEVSYDKIALGVVEMG
ncbi:MAG: peptidylprolyl isomerase [Oscillospiraceae bacterium]